MKLLLLALSSLLASAQIRINCGGPAFTDSSGTLWSADQFFIGGTTFNGPLPEPLGTVRYQAAPFSYSIPAPAGNYILNMFFQEQFVTGVGARKFNVVVNGQAVITNLDIFATSGANQYLASFPVTSSGFIQITFTTVTRSAMINAIEILPVITPPPPPPPVLSMVKETWIFIPVAATPPGTGSPSSFQIQFQPDPATIPDVYLNGLLQSSLHSPWDYLVHPTTPPTFESLNPGIAHPVPNIPQFPQVFTVQYWTTKSPAVEILH